ncbi:DUF6694 family lipoprotein [Usitatibacter rugosus]|uniref:DUF6694 family lipoprotein n=1 Tax=Usitatibacter rugosus TaxID=2732067 RepID=UPI0014883829|nr:DUF6694 family lipoprotein [Usitatibacter rugosus]
MFRAILLASTLALAACSGGLDQKLDGSSEAAYRTSLNKVRNSVSEEDRKQLDESLRILAVSDVSIGFEGGILTAVDKLRSTPLTELAEPLMPQVNGRTGRDIVAAAKLRMKEQAERQLATSKIEIEKLTRARKEKESARDFLAKVEILEPRIAIVGTDAQRMGILDFKVSNGSEEVLSSLFLRATVKGADDKVLMTDEFTYKASPPIAAGQVRDVRLPSSSPNKWNSSELAKQAQLALQLQVENAATLAGSKLAASFTQKDADRLALLEKQKPVLEALVAAK